MAGNAGDNEGWDQHNEIGKKVKGGLAVGRGLASLLRTFGVQKRVAESLIFQGSAIIAAAFLFLWLAKMFIGEQSWPVTAGVILLLTSVIVIVVQSGQALDGGGGALRGHVLSWATTLVFISAMIGSAGVFMFGYPRSLCLVYSDWGWLKSETCRTHVGSYGLELLDPGEVSNRPSLAPVSSTALTIIDKSLSDIGLFLERDLVKSLDGRDGVLDPMVDWKIIVESAAAMRSVYYALPEKQVSAINGIVEDLQNDLNVLVEILRAEVAKEGGASAASPEIIKSCNQAIDRAREEYQRSVRAYYFMRKN